MYIKNLYFFNKTILNVFHNFILNKIITCNDKDPLGMNEEIDSLMKKKTWLYQRQRKSVDDSATDHGIIYFNNMPIVKENALKHLATFLHVKLTFLEHTMKKSRMLLT